MNVRLKKYLSVFIVAGVFAAGVQAQSLLLEEVTVTATKREENLQDVGISVTAFTDEQVEAMGMETMGEIADHVPGLEYKRLWGGKGNNSLFFIRGLGQADFNEGSESPANVYVDDFYVISNSAIDFLVHDVETVEILRGPQGTLFGRNSTAGAVNIRNNRPGYEFQGDATFLYGNYERREVMGMVNVPIIDDRLAARFAFDLDRNDYHVKNHFPGANGRPGDEGNREGDFESYRLSTLWEPNEDLSVLYRFQFGKVDAVTIGDLSDPLQFGVGEIIAAPTDAFGYHEELAGVAGPDDVNSDSTNHVDNEMYIHIVNASYHINENLSLTSITGYFDQDKRTLEDCDGTPRSLCGLRQFTIQDYLTQELRLNYDTDRYKLTMGAFYLDQDYFNTWQLYALSGSGTNEALGFAPNTPGGLIQLTPNDIDVKGYAIYGNLAYDINDRFTATVGLRYNREEKDIAQSEGLFVHDFPDTGTVTTLGQTHGFISISDPGWDDFIANHIGDEADPVGDPNIDYVGRYRDDFLNYKLQLDWRVSEDVLLYASYRHGAKAGGFNNGLTNYNAANLDLIPFAREEADNFEVGVKMDFWEGRGRLNASTFYMDISDYQASAFIGGLTSIGTFVLNRDARSYGFEAELTLNPITNLDLLLSVGYLDTKVEDITNTGSGVSITRDRELGHSPKWQSNGLVRYTWPIHDKFNLVGSANYSYLDSRFIDVLNDPGTELKSYLEGNGGLALESTDAKWTLKAYVKNISNTRPVFQRFAIVGLGGTGQANYLPPRRYGISLTYRW